VNEERKIAKKTVAGKVEPLKRGVLRDDLWEDVAIRHSVAKCGGDEDGTCRVHPEVDEETGKARLTSVGKPEVLERLDRVLRAKEVDHERLEVQSYPGDAGFPAEKAREIVAPRLFRTLRAIREELGLPEPPLLEERTVELERTVERGLDQLLGQGSTPRNSESGKGGDAVAGLTKALEDFTPRFDRETI
jgi:hypothetical protein